MKLVKSLKLIAGTGNMCALMHSDAFRYRTPLEALMLAATQENKAAEDCTILANAVQLLM
jgi:hypothetical protein